MNYKEKMQHIVDCFIKDKSIEYKPEERGEDYEKIKVASYKIGDPRSPMKVYCNVHAYTNDDGESPIYVFKTEKEAEEWVMKHKNFEKIGLHLLGLRHWLSAFITNKVMKEGEVRELFANKDWKRITRIMLDKCGAEYFLSLGIPPYRYGSYIFYTYIFEDDSDYTYMRKELRF